MTIASGTIFKTGGKERMPKATIKASKKGANTVYAQADKDGNFTLNLPEPGNWELVAFEEKSSASDPISVKMDQDQLDIEISLRRIGETVDEKKGKTFFWILVGALGVLIALYLVLHLVIFNTGKGFEIWSVDPLRYLEIILWGLAGILVSKIINIGWYLRSGRYYQEGLLMHISHIVATPILVLVIVLLLSQVVLKFTLANSNEISLNLSIPALMVAFAFIIGTSPWALWNFVVDSAKRFTGQLK
jgi:hypothetical protein